MRVIIDGHTYQSQTATGLVEQIKGMHWQAGEDATTEQYIAAQESTYRRLAEKPMQLPEGDTEARALAMFKAVAEFGGWIFKED